MYSLDLGRNALKAIGQVKAVCDNMDCHKLKNMLPQTELFTIGEKRIRLVHGAGGPWGIAERVRKLFPDAHVVIFGHSHEPCDRYLRGTFLFNLGPARNSFGLITIDGGVKAEIMWV
jgi:predicted phosphodiesterase